MNFTVTIMKTQLNQVITITTFFSLMIGATLAISWGVSDMLVEDKSCQEETFSTVILNEVKENLNLNNSFKLLIPKLK